MELSQLRRLIPATNGMVYLNTGWNGISPEPVLRRMEQAMREESAVGAASVQGLAQNRAIEIEAQKVLAQLFKCTPQEVLMTHGTTEGVNIVLHGFPWKRGDELLTCDLEHPAIEASSQVVAERYGITVRTAHVPPAATISEMVHAIQRAMTHRTRLIALSHVQFTVGLKMPMKEIAEVAHAAGVYLLVDGAQTGGHVAIDVQDMRADFYAISGQKWLLGPQGTGALYVRNDLWDMLKPLTHRERMVEAGAPPASQRTEYSLTSRSYVLEAGLAEAANIALSIGLPAIEAHTCALSTRLKQSLQEIPGVTLTGPMVKEVSCGLTSVSLAGWEPTDVVNTLWDRYRIAARQVRKPAGVRFSTASFNNDTDVDAVVAAMSELATGKGK